MKNNTNQEENNVDPLIDQTKANKNNERFENLLVDGIPYRIEYEPFFFNDQVRYYVSVNAGPKDVFVWDTEVELFRAIDDKSGVLPIPLEKAISTLLQNQNLD